MMRGFIGRVDGLFPDPELAAAAAAEVGGAVSPAGEISAFLLIRIVNLGLKSEADNICGADSTESEFDANGDDTEGGTWSIRIWSTIQDKSSRWRVDLNYENYENLTSLKKSRKRFTS